MFDFSDPDAVEPWQAVNDAVMGGLSRGSMVRAEGGFARFSGEVSLERGGGFASVRTKALELGRAGASAFVLTVRGDGKRYKLTARADDAFDGVQYQAAFVAHPGPWQTVRLPLSGFAPTFRGRTLSGVAPLEAASIRAVGFLISDRQAGPFALEVARIVLE